MSDLTGDDILGETASRGEDGELLPETKTIRWKDTTKQVKVRPVTIGRINELEARYSGDFDALDTEALRVIIFEQYVEPDLARIYEDSGKEWSDLKAARVKDLAGAFEDLDEKADSEGDEGNPAAMSRQDRAAEMR